VLCALLAIVATADAANIKVAAPTLGGVNVKPDVAVFWTDHLAQQITLRGPQVLTGTEIAALLGMERQRQLLGCAEQSSSCIAELANALGTDAVVTGSVGHFDTGYQVNLKIIRSRDGRLIAAFSGEAKAEGEVLGVLTRAAEAMTPKLLAAFGGQAEAAPSKPLPRRLFSVIPAVLAIVGIVVGSVELKAESDAAAELRMPTQAFQQELVTYRNGSQAQTIGVASLIAGGVLLAGAVVLFFLLGDST
jgi:hypothetical protein